ncbi:hypothetical protein SAMD00019534_026700, partial [Acytostelium subglobosum LB1]|uniref:hypothetical protein n=1 Tax=Acytostelium subglobosum LB1 TaxID=1410327 RepID=UPI000644A67A
VQGNFNQEIFPNDLPRSLRYLSFGDTYNKIIKERILPDGLTSLSFGRQYNQYFPNGVLPNSLTSLILGHHYMEYFQLGCLPNSLTHLQIHGSFQAGFIEGVLPQSLRTLLLPHLYKKQILPGVLPKSITNLKFGGNMSSLFWQCIPIAPGTLPQSLTKLSMTYGCELEPKSLPSTLKHLTITLRSSFVHDLGPWLKKNCLNIGPALISRLWTLTINHKKLNVIVGAETKLLMNEAKSFLAEYPDYADTYHLRQLVVGHGIKNVSLRPLDQKVAIFRLVHSHHYGYYEDGPNDVTIGFLAI